MTRWLAARQPQAGPALQLACRAQHFRRWEIPRSAYPMTRPGYLTWRAKLKSQAAAQVAALLTAETDVPPTDVARVAALIRKENLAADEETQVLEDVACLVFLDDQFDGFESKEEIDEPKIIGILQKTWAKMSEPGRALALKMDLSERATALITKALAGKAATAPLASSPFGSTEARQSPEAPTTAGTAFPAPATSQTKPPLDTLISAHDFEAVASTTFPPKAWAFVSSAATDLHTKRRNAEAYASITLRPRVLRQVATVDTSTTMLSHATRLPLFAPPTAMAKLVHPEGEKALGRALKASGMPQTVSVSASYSLADILAAHATHDVATPYDVPVFFQLYALVLTVDAPLARQARGTERVRSDESLASPISGAAAKNDARGGALGRIMGSYIDANVCWDDIAWLRRTVPGLPIVLKGIQTWMDAVRAAEHGVEAIIVSNHGGRSLDTSPATILVLLELQKNCPDVFDKMEVYVDGGVTRGTDIFKALCLGARGVGVGRGLLYALNYGTEGVERYIDILRDELETTMKMCGVTSLDQVHPGYLNTAAVDHLIPGKEEHPYAKWRPSQKSRL
ncbi:cytochrome b2 [Verticillium alfalfae VaMs.102]|uniref:Cytochrome b2 n=1 Tax=Verticillium alfalfae (strain VaMs.102 / ATCC MYA-4576 / FGSC 10136) TaxID=526221 RepID=C9SG81_VERA1|nr:cytochrome b2 [Verticillium alfalfae VaMs.102]EEY18095.1 cytochrome b2 [Verticillium alfalfae VaMs.102]